MISLDCYSFHFLFCFFPLVHLSILPKFLSHSGPFFCVHMPSTYYDLQTRLQLFTQERHIAPHHAVLLPACLSPKGDISLSLGPVIYYLCLKVLWRWPLGSRSAQREETQQSLPIGTHSLPPAVCPCEKLTVSREEAGRGGKGRQVWNTSKDLKCSICSRKWVSD